MCSQRKIVGSIPSQFKPMFAVEFHNTALMTTIKGLLVRIKDNVSQLSDKETGVAVEKDEAQVYPDTLPEL